MAFSAATLQGCTSSIRGCVPFETRCGGDDAKDSHNNRHHEAAGDDVSQYSVQSTMQDFQLEKTGPGNLPATVTS